MENLLLEGVVGSRAYGLATADSDTDYAGVYVEPTRRLLGLHPPTQRSRTGRAEADAVYHEVGKAMGLMLSCNPTAYELLWLDDYTATTGLGREMVALRTCFASAPRVRRAYFGYACAQARDLQRNPHPAHTRRAKQARHTMRLLWQGYRLYTTGFLPVRLADPQRFHDFGARVAAEGAEPVQALLADYETAFDAATPALPEDPDEQCIDDLLQRIRQEYLDREAQ